MPLWWLLCNSYHYFFKFHIQPEMKVHVIQLSMLSIRMWNRCLRCNTFQRANTRDQLELILKVLILNPVNIYPPSGGTEKCTVDPLILTPQKCTHWQCALLSGPLRKCIGFQYWSDQSHFAGFGLTIYVRNSTAGSQLNCICLDFYCLWSDFRYNSSVI